MRRSREVSRIKGAKEQELGGELRAGIVGKGK